MKSSTDTGDARLKRANLRAYLALHTSHFPPQRRDLVGSWIQKAGIAGLSDLLSLEDYLTLPHILASFSGRQGIVNQVLKTSGRERSVQSALTHFSALPPFLEQILFECMHSNR